jgi:hypothetical protein
MRTKNMMACGGEGGFVDELTSKVPGQLSAIKLMRKSSPTNKELRGQGSKLDSRDAD